MLATDADAPKGLPPSLDLYLSPSPEIFVVSSLLIFISCGPSMNLRAHGLNGGTGIHEFVNHSHRIFA
jgi:hypothetical protein